MKKELLIEYGNLINSMFQSAKLTNYFLANLRNEGELENMIDFVRKNPNLTATDLDEHIIMIRQ